MYNHRIHTHVLDKAIFAVDICSTLIEISTNTALPMHHIVFPELIAFIYDKMVGPDL